MKIELIIIERIFNSPAGKVWNAITDINQMKQWYFKQLNSFIPDVGFQTQFIVTNNGKDYLHIWRVTEAIPNKKMSYEWRYGVYPGNSLVTFDLLADGNKTKVILTHKDLETFQPERNPELAKENFEAGWKSIINISLKEFVEKKSN